MERGRAAPAVAARASQAPPLLLLLAQAAAPAGDSGGATWSSASCQAEAADREKGVERAVPLAALRAAVPPKGGLWAHSSAGAQACTPCTKTLSLGATSEVAVAGRGMAAMPGHCGGEGGAPAPPEKPHEHVRLKAALAEYT